MNPKSNVLFLVADSLRYDMVASDNLAHTPTLDRLGDEGTVLEMCISQGISTAPAMMAMLTGRYPLSYGGHWYVHDDQPTMAEQFQYNDYETAAIHSNPNVSRLRNFDKGFSTFKENILPFPSEGLLNTLPNTILRYLNKGARILGRTPYLPADAINAQIIEWVETTNSPWFLWTQYMDTHGPYISRDKFSYRDKFQSERLWRKAAVNSPEKVTETEHKRLRRNYQNEIEHFDAALGRLLETMADCGQLENTITIVMSDHGDEFNEHGLYGHKNLPYEELVHVPCIINFPDSISLDLPETIKSPVRCIDVLPTVLDVIDARLTSEMRNRMSGQPIQSIVSDKQSSPSVLLTEKQMRNNDSLRFGFRTDRWTYLYDGTDDSEQLYDRRRDPNEQMDIVEDHPNIVERFRDCLEQRINAIEATSADFETPTVGVNHDPGVQQRLRALGYRE